MKNQSCSTRARDFGRHFFSSALAMRPVPPTIILIKSSVLGKVSLALTIQLEIARNLIETIFQYGYS